MYSQIWGRQYANHLRLVNESVGPDTSDPSPVLKHPEPMVGKRIENVCQMNNVCQMLLFLFTSSHSLGTSSEKKLTNFYSIIFILF